MKIDCIQGSPEWLFERIGRCTASRVADAVSFLKRGDKQGQESKARMDYRLELICERLTGRCTDHYVSEPMIEGLEKEPLAKACYEAENDCTIEDVGLVVHDAIPYFSCSPDGWIGSEGMLQVKCPLPHTHLSYILDGGIPKDYQAQMIAELACCPERKYNDFVSYCPIFPKEFRLFTKRMLRDDTRITELENGVVQFLEEVAEQMEQLKLRGDLTPILKKSLEGVSK